MTKKVSLQTFYAALVAFVLTSVPQVEAQRPQKDWDALFERTEGWLGADGIYSLELPSKDGERQRLFWFSDSFFGTTRENGREFDQRTMVNHSFALLSGEEPDGNKIEFFCKRSEGGRAGNLIDGKYWLQDGTIVDGRLWLTAILVGDAWKPDRIDAVSIALDPESGRPDFSDVQVDRNAPLSFKTRDAQVVWGAAIYDGSDDDYVYVFGYVDRLREFSRKDAVVARVRRDSFTQYDAWEFWSGDAWTANARDVVRPQAVLARAVSTEFSVSKIPSGQNAGRLLLVYTPNTIGSDVAFRLADKPNGPFGAENVFYRSDVPKELPGVKCYNAKAHTIVQNEDGVLVSYNVNRLGDMAHKPEEYRPRFIWLTWETVDQTSKTKEKYRKRNSIRR